MKINLEDPIGWLASEYSVDEVLIQNIALKAAELQGQYGNTAEYWEVYLVDAYVKELKRRDQKPTTKVRKQNKVKNKRKMAKRSRQINRKKK